ncbi:MAG TPA: DUF4845 domain-containing protein [Methylophilus sp.]|nr:DUF4845 domain-containing protein [Methylophilus sp.]HQQ33550.1 DUF4845 domain-containing protein [Methylophilus sp.]
MQIGVKDKQQGMTFIGLVIVVAAIVFFAMIGMKVVPAYIEFFSVKKVLQHMASEPNFNEMGKKEIMETFDKGANVGYVTVIKGSDLLIERGEAGNVVTADYQVTLPIVANASILLDFHASTQK